MGEDVGPMKAGVEVAVVRRLTIPTPVPVARV